MTFGDADYYRRQYFAARARADAAEADAKAGWRQACLEHDNLAAANAECARLKAWIRGGVA